MFYTLTGTEIADRINALNDHYMMNLEFIG